MKLNDYQKKASTTAVYPGRGTFLGLMYVTGKLCGEAGEFSENTFKALRDDGIASSIETYEENSIMFEGTITFADITFSNMSTQRKEKAKKELGDILWYVSNAAYELGVSLEEIADINLEKLSKRKEENKLHGSGSER